MTVISLQLSLWSFLQKKLNILNNTVERIWSRGLQEGEEEGKQRKEEEKSGKKTREKKRKRKKGEREI